jgi:cysteine desulfurase
MVSIMDVNNEIGTIQPMDIITSLCQKNGAIFHTDAAQSMPTKTIDVKQSNIDLLSLSAHKIYGPKGIGAIYIRKGLEKSIQPLQWGGGQEQGLRSGTLPTPLCVGFGKAMEIIQKERAEIISNISKQRNLFYEECIREKKEISLVGPSFDNRHIGNLSICFHGYDAEDIISIMQPNLAVSTGSACTSGMPEPSHVLNAIGMLSNDVKSVIRFSFGKYLTNDDSILSMSILLEALDKVDSRK